MDQDVDSVATCPIQFQWLSLRGSRSIAAIKVADSDARCFATPQYALRTLLM